MDKKSLSTPLKLLEVFYLQSKYPGRYSAMGAIIGGDRSWKSVDDLDAASEWEEYIPLKLRSDRVRLFKNYEYIYNTSVNSDGSQNLSGRLSPEKINHTIMECIRGLTIIGMAARSAVKASRTHGERLWNDKSKDREIENQVDSMIESLVMLDPELDATEANFQDN